MKKILCVLASILPIATSHAQDQRVVDSLQTALSVAKHDTTRANILFYLSRAYWGSNPDKAMGFAEQCLAFSEQKGYKKGMGLAYQSMSGVSYDRGDYYQALELNKKSLKIRTEIGDKKGIAACYNLFGTIYWRQNNGPESLKNYLASVSLAEEIGDKNGVANATIGLGLIYQNQKNYSAAIKSFSTALKLKTEVGEKVGVHTSYNNIANIYQVQGNYDEALRNQFASLSVAEEIGHKSGIASSYNNIGVTYVSQGNYTEALRYILRAKKLREELVDKSAVINSYINLGYLYLKQKKYQEADESNNKALSLAKEIGKLGGLKNAYENMAQSDSAQGNFSKALQHYKLFAAIQDSLRSNDNIRKVIAMQKDYEYGKKEDSIKSVQKQKDALVSAELEKQRLRNELLAKQYEDSLKQQEHEKKLAALNMKFTFDKAQDSTKAEQLKKDAISNKELQRQKLVRNGFISGFAVVLLFSVLFLFQRNNIKKGKKLSDNLLLNILPAEVAEELKAKGSAEAKHFENVTVEFFQKSSCSNLFVADSCK